MGDLHKVLVGLSEADAECWAQSLPLVRNQLTSFVKHFPLFAHLFGQAGIWSFCATSLEHGQDKSNRKEESCQLSRPAY